MLEKVHSGVPSRRAIELRAILQVTMILRLESIAAAESGRSRSSTRQPENRQGGAGGRCLRGHAMTDRTSLADRPRSPACSTACPFWAW